MKYVHILYIPVNKGKMFKAVDQNKNRENTHFIRRYFVGFGGFPLVAMLRQETEKPLLDYKVHFVRCT